jgi:hypothetical protein
VAAFTLLTEKKETEEPPERHRRYRKPVLYSLTVVAFILGAWQIRNADKENREAESQRTDQHQKDQLKISRLQQSVTTLGKVNDTQYQRNQDELAALRQQLTGIKVGELTAPDRRRMAALEEQLNKAFSEAESRTQIRVLLSQHEKERTTTPRFLRHFRRKPGQDSHRRRQLIRCKCHGHNGVGPHLRKMRIPYRTRQLSQNTEFTKLRPNV